MQVSHHVAVGSVCAEELPPFPDPLRLGIAGAATTSSMWHV